MVTNKSCQAGKWTGNARIPPRNVDRLASVTQVIRSTVKLVSPRDFSISAIFRSLFIVLINFLLTSYFIQTGAGHDTLVGELETRCSLTISKEPSMWRHSKHRGQYPVRIDCSFSRFTGTHLGSPIKVLSTGRPIRPVGSFQPMLYIYAISNVSPEYDCFCLYCNTVEMVSGFWVHDKTNLYLF